MSKKYCLHVLELVRNNSQPAKERNGKCRFLMFDYFDILIHKELTGEEKTYTNYFSIEDTFQDDEDYKVSYKTLSLYCEADSGKPEAGSGEGGEGAQKDAGKDPFFVEEAGEELSDAPFLGLIQISLCKENYENWDKSVRNVDEFLNACEREIQKKADAAIGLEDGGKTYRKMYRSSTTGDFCLAIRTDSVKKIYRVAMALNDSQYDSKGCPVLTYTNVGIECKKCSDSFATLSESFVEKHSDMCFALRFSADRGILSILKDKHDNKADGGCRLERVKGLFGRYDYLLHIGIKEFATLYPALCEKKLGQFVQGKLSLANVLGYPNIRNINERILVDLTPMSPDEAKGEDSGKSNGCGEEKTIEGEVREKNKELYKKIEELNKWRSCFAEEDRSFRDLHRGMIGIYRMYSAIGMEKEAYLNWKIFYQDMERLCECLESCFEKYEGTKKENTIQDEEEKRRNRSRLLKDWRINIQAINLYTRLVQNINYQTYQSPIYEIQTQIDTEKTMIAYRQAMGSYMESYAKDEKTGKEKNFFLLPVIYPDVSKDAVEVTAPFTGQKAGKSGHMDPVIVCTIPSFEYFGRLYDLLPWMVHESSHHLSVLAPEERNKVFVKYIFRNIYVVMMERLLPELANDILYRTVGRAERQLIDGMVEETVEELLGEKVRNADVTFEKLSAEVRRYLEQMFPKWAKRDTEDGFDEKGAMSRIYQFYLSEYRKAGRLEEYMEKILNVKKKNNRKWEEEREVLAQGLLKWYEERLGQMRSEHGDQGQTLRISVRNLDRRQEWFEEVVLENEEELEKENSDVAIREWSAHVMELYRIYQAQGRLHQKSEDESEQLKNYLERVYDRYWKGKKSEHSVLPQDPVTLHMLRNLGLLNEDKDKDKKRFCSQMRKAFRNIDHEEAYERMKMRATIYGESFADLLMVTALNIDSFGYIRQVLQTISDARTDEYVSFRENDVNMERFQIVLAVLLAEEQSGEKEVGGLTDRVTVNGETLIKKGEIYCEATLRCILEKLMKMDGIKDNAGMEELVSEFLNCVLEQAKVSIRNDNDEDDDKCTYLHILLHGRKEADGEMLERWDAYQFNQIADICEKVKYIFWRLERFCYGLNRVLKSGRVIVERDIFEYMREVRETAREKNGKSACRWGNEWECLIKAKKDVRDFYNNPELVYDKKSSEKLENTIDFIQNYYYYNRFRMAEESEGAQSGA